jgi:hypothetical protein
MKNRFFEDCEIYMTEIIVIILICIVIMFCIGGIYRASKENSNIPTKVEYGEYQYKIIQFNNHTYIQNHPNVLVHDPDCTNSKCFKE